MPGENGQASGCMQKWLLRHKKWHGQDWPLNHDTVPAHETLYIQQLLPKNAQTSGVLRTGSCITTMCQPNIHNDCFAYNTVLTSFNITAHRNNQYNIQYPHPNFETPSSMKSSSYTVQPPRLPVLPPIICTEHYFVFTAQVKQTTYTTRSFLTSNNTAFPYSAVVITNDCTYMQHWTRKFSVITWLLSMKENVLSTINRRMSYMIISSIVVHFILYFYSSIVMITASVV